MALRLLGVLDAVALRRSLDGVFARHEALRSVFVTRDGEPHVELLAADSGLPLAQDDLRGVAGAQARLTELNIQEAQTPFDLARGPLIRGRLVRMAEEDHVLRLTQHHLVSDGW